MKPLMCVILVACAAEETELPPLVATAEEPPPPQEKLPTEPPPMAERDVARCEEVKRLKQEGGASLEQKKYDDAKKSYLRAIELDPADKDAPGQLAKIDKATESNSTTSIEHSQAIGAARSPCEPPQKKAPVAVVQKTPEAMQPGLASQSEGVQPPPTQATPPSPPPSSPEVRQDGNVIITAKDQKAAKSLPTVADVTKKLMKEDGHIVACYTSALTRDTTLSGKATYQMTFDKDGKVSETSTSDSSVYDPAMHGCINGVLKKLKLDKKPGGQVDIYYALAFSPKKAATNEMRKLKN